jgi:hypothetical protein
MKVSFSSLFVTVYTLIAGLTIAFYAPEAEACSPPPPGVYSSIPESGSLLPSNAAVVFTGRAFSIDDFIATVDGVSADVIGIPELSVNYFDSFSHRLAMKIEPEPVAGQQVTLLSCIGAMWDSAEDNNNCTQFNFTITEADHAPPPTPFSAAFNIHDHAAYQPGCCFCQSDSDIAYYLDIVGVEQASSTQAASFVSVQAYLSSDSTQATVFESLLHGDAYALDTAFRLGEQTLAGNSAQNAFCFRIQAFDAAMNPASELITLCDPCHLKTTTDPIGEFEMPPSEPTWETADLITDGTCLSDPCDILDCPDNTHCVPRPTDEGGEMTIMHDCLEDEEPVCDKECEAGYHCKLVTVSCFTTPCPPIDTCVENTTLPDGGMTGDPCADLNCPANTHCESNGDSDLNIQDHCVVDDDPQCTLECPPGNLCELMTVTCVMNPCPPVQTCTDLPDSGVQVPTETVDAGTATETDETADAGTATETDETADAGTATETEEIIDAGSTTEPEETDDAGTTTEPENTNDSGTTDEEDSINLDSNLSSSSDMNCECGTTHSHNSAPHTLLFLGFFVCILSRSRRQGL